MLCHPDALLQGWPQYLEISTADIYNYGSDRPWPLALGNCLIRGYVPWVPGCGPILGYEAQSPCLNLEHSKGHLSSRASQRIGWSLGGNNWHYWSPSLSAQFWLLQFFTGLSPERNKSCDPHFWTQMVSG